MGSMCGSLLEECCQAPLQAEMLQGRAIETSGAARAEPFGHQVLLHAVDHVPGSVLDEAEGILEAEGGTENTMLKRSTGRSLR